MKKIKTVLLINAGFSTFCAIALLIFASSIAQLMNIESSTILQIIGIALIFFVGMLLFVATRSPINKKQVQFIILQDGLWVVGSVLIIAFQAFGISTIGYFLIGIVASLVGFFGWIQQRLIVL